MIHRNALAALGVALWCAAGSANAAVLTVGASGANYNNLADALTAVSETNSTIRFIDSNTYEVTIAATLTDAKYEGLTIESATGQHARLEFSGAASYGLNLGRTNMTIQNLTLVNTGRSGLMSLDGNATNATITGVNFISNVSGASVYLLSASTGTSISYSTFLGASTSSTGNKGIYANNNNISIDHCSFDRLGFAPIYNTSDVTFSLTNSAFGVWNSSAAYKAAAYIEAGTLNEDYNASYINKLAYAHPNVSTATVNSGGNSFVLANFFVGDTSAGDWEVSSELYTAASDGSTVGAWQVPEPASLVLMGAAGVMMTSCRRKH